MAVLLVAAACLVLGIWGGLLRMGAPLPVASAPALHHGALMVGGFLGTLIGVERAVALGRGWAWAAPLLTALGAVLVVAGQPGQVAILAGSIAFVAANLAVVWRQPADHTGTMALGAGAWAVGNALWVAGTPVWHVVAWWSAFLVLTIAGERLELSRLVPRGRWGRPLFAIAAGAYLAGVVASVAVPGAGARVAGLGLIGLSAWMARYDVVRRTVRAGGLARYVAVALVCGYAWLFVAGVLGLVCGDVRGGLPYDAALHALFVGFVFSMVFAHAPIVLPAVLRVGVPWHPVLYVPVAVLQVTVAVRVVGGVIGDASWRLGGGVAHTVALVLFAASMAFAATAGRRITRP